MESRKLCLNCTLKHLAQALVLLGEVEKGYPMHRYIAMGHMAEAEDECSSRYPDMAAKIRDCRLSIEEGNGPSHSLEDLIQDVHDIKAEHGSGCDSCGK